MSVTRPFAAKVAAVAVAAVLATAGGYAFANARDAATAGAPYAAGAGFHEVLGATHAIGAFNSTGDACAMTVVIGAANVEDVLSEPARLEFSLPSGQQAAMKTRDGGALTFTCSADASTVRIAKTVANAS